MDAATRLDIALKNAGIPIQGVSADENTQTARIDFDKTATDQNKKDAQALLAAFDWSKTAADSADNIQSRTDVKSILDGTDAQAKLIRAIVMYNLQQIKIAVPSYTLPTRAQATASIKAILDSGTAD